MPKPNWIKTLWWNGDSQVESDATSSSPQALLARNPQASAFPDVPTNHWARDYIQTLAELQIISGFPDGSFRPEAPVTRAQFAAILRQAFPADVDLRNVKSFSDVSPGYWATNAIRTTRATGFLSGYPGNRFRPEQNIPRVQALVSLSNGLDYTDQRFNRETNRDTLSYYQDSNQIPAYARPSLAAATDLGLVVNYPNLRQLNPNRNASRAEIAAFVYQALYQEGKAPSLDVNPHRVIATSLAWQAEPIATLPIQATQLSFNGPGTRLASLNSTANQIQVWDVEVARSLTRISTNPQHQFAAMALSEDGEKVVAIVQASIDFNLTLKAWSVATGQLLWQQPFPLQQLGGAASQLANNLTLKLAMRPRHNEVLVQTSLAVAPAGQAPEIQLHLHDLETGEVNQSLNVTSGIELLQSAFSFRGGYLAALGTIPADGPFSGRNQRLELWQLSDGSRLPSIVPTDSELAYFSIAFTPNGSLRAIAQHLYDIQLDTWDIRSSQRIDQITQLPDIDRQDRLGRLSPDGVTYFVRSDVAGTRLIHSQIPSVMPLSLVALQAVFSGKGDHLAIATATTLQVFSQSWPR